MHPEIQRRPPAEEGPPPEPARADRRERAERKRLILNMDDIIPDDRRILETPIFAPGDVVCVQRSSGEIDDGWEVVRTDQESSRVLVVKQIGGQLAEKRINELELADPNP